MTLGIRARAWMSLNEDSDPDRAWGALASGSRSLIFKFADPDAPDGSISLGAMMTTPDAVPLAWGDTDREVALNFWDDAARLYVHEGAEFSVWYSRTIGRGSIGRLIIDLDDP
ncbi:hypothetical protein [Rudaeicoccus suwonensis]|uniref:Uncharacterized protein n=1 Tax=Rudaeicoccus suwonensis TaxID=657409 RepID=A0A561E874_9MICO|nr:hypothetical protein [Rudaeicoccus suwonensis]TWE11760.1 hypothetical protein BKA23_0546 [Rudaeicoccus suwonensis]